MPRLSTLNDDLAERFSFERTKLESLTRRLREAGLITSGARGVNAPSATFLDAARLLIVMMLDSKMPTVVEDIQLVGQFTVLTPDKLTKGFAPKTLEEGLARLLHFFGTASANVLEDFTASFELVPFAALAEVIILKIPEEGQEQETRVVFTHPDVTLDTLNDLDQLPASYHAASRRFPVGFNQRPNIQRHHLVEIGRLVLSRDQ